MISTTRLTASAQIRSASLVLVDLLTEEGVTGHSYVFCVTPLAPMARLVSNLGPLIVGDVREFFRGVR